MSNVFSSVLMSKSDTKYLFLPIVLKRLSLYFGCLLLTPAPGANGIFDASMLFSIFCFLFRGVVLADDGDLVLFSGPSSVFVVDKLVLFLFTFLSTATEALLLLLLLTGFFAGFLVPDVARFALDFFSTPRGTAFDFADLRTKFLFLDCFADTAAGVATIFTFLLLFRIVLFIKTVCIKLKNFLIL